MSKLLRSEEMALVEIFFGQEAAYNCVRELGELGLIQFSDLNEGVNSFARNYVSEIRRTEEMERRLRFFAGEIEKEKLQVPANYEMPSAPNQKDLIDLEATLEQLENETRQINANQEALLRNFYELKELRHVLNSASKFFQQGAAIRQDRMSELKADEETGARHLSFVCGVIERAKLPVFERVLWRSSRGKALLRHMEIEEPLKDPATGEEIKKETFTVYFQGEQLKLRVKKICEGLGATLYPCKESHEERKQTEKEVDKRINELQEVLKQTTDHRFRMLNTVVATINPWVIQVRKTKAIYYTLNKFKNTDTGLRAMGWCSVRDLGTANNALKRGSTEAGSVTAPLINIVQTNKTPPTYNRSNKVTLGYQAIIDAYGVATYQEINPAIFAMITFPFLFGVMFGDIGHGLIMFLIGLYLVLREDYFLKRIKQYEEVFTMIFSGRYIVLMNGVFAMYCGLLYNDMFSKSINLFGSSWSMPTGEPYEFASNNSMFGLNPSSEMWSGKPYFFGVDPMWNLAENKLVFINSFKMKLAVILGLLQMSFGVILSYFNYRFKGETLKIYCQFIPQIIFLQCLIGYLAFMIFFKWCFVTSTTEAQPSLLICLINMFLAFGTVAEENKLYPYQVYVQSALVIVALLCVPWMLAAKPIIEMVYPRIKQAKRLKENAPDIRVEEAAEIPLEDVAEVSAKEEADEEASPQSEAEPLMPATNGDAVKSSEIIEISEIIETVAAPPSGKFKCDEKKGLMKSVRLLPC